MIMLVIRVLLLASGIYFSTGMAAALVDLEQPASSLNKNAYQKLQQGDYELAYQISIQALHQSKVENNRKEEARALSNLASNLYYFGDREKALTLYCDSLEISKEDNDLVGINRALNNIANIYFDLSDYTETQKYRELQLANSLLSGDITDQLTAHIAFSQNYSYQKKFVEAKQSADHARNLLEISPNKFMEIYLLMTEALIDELQQKYSQPIELVSRANVIAVENNFEGLVISTNANLVEYYLYEKKFAEAIKLGVDTLRDAKKAVHKNKVLQLHKSLSEAYKAIGQFETALYHLTEVNLLNSSIVGEKIRVLSEVTKIDRQMAEKEEQLIQITKDQEIMSLSLEKQKQSQIIWVAVISTLFMLIFLLYYRRNSNRELLRQKEVNRQLEELDRVKDRVLTNTSHELRTPLNGIIGLSEIIIHDEEKKLSESTLKSIKLIKSSGEQLSLVINDILELSKLKSSKLTIVKSEFDLRELINDVVDVCESQSDLCEPVITKQEIENTHFIFQDRNRMQQILFNIIGNAVKFTNSGTINISAKVTEAVITIVVSDTGIGIPDDKQERIFEGFEQVDSSNNRSRSGSGLGLAISRGIAEALGGELTLVSKLGLGTTVKLIVPNKPNTL